MLPLVPGSWHSQPSWDLCLYYYQARVSQERWIERGQFLISLTWLLIPRENLPFGQTYNPQDQKNK